MGWVHIEDFYEVPATEVVLVGGPHDGKRMFIPDDRQDWMMPAPEPAPTIQSLLAAASRDPQPILPKITLYRWTGSIRDDGVRVFRAA